MQITKPHHLATHRQQSGSVSSAKGGLSPFKGGQHEGQSPLQGDNLLDSGAQHQPNRESQSTPFDQLVDNSDILKRKFLGNTVEAKSNQQSTARPEFEQATSSKPALSEDQALADITEQFQAQFKENASDPEAFHSLLQKSFGDTYDKAAAETIRQQTLDGDFGWMPDIKLVDGSTLSDVSGQQPGAQGLGAYSKGDDTIFLSRELLAEDPAKAEAILTEEVGHALDARINTRDAAGDEGDIFSRLLHGEQISDTQLTELRSENDSGTIVVEGNEVEVEFGLGSFLKKTVGKVVDTVKGVGEAVVDGVKKVGEAVVDGVKKVGEAVVDGVKKVGEAVVDVVKGYYNAIWDGFVSVMNSELFNQVLMVAQFIPIPIVQVAVRVINIAKAAYSVYQGVKHGSIAMVAGGVASAFGGAAKLGEALGSTAQWVGTAAKVSTVANQVGAAHQVIAEKNLGAAAALASNYFGGDSTAASVLNTAVKVDNVVKAVENDNVFGIVSSGSTLLQDFTGPQGDVFLSTIDKHTDIVQKIDTARKTGDYSQAIGLVRENFGDALNIPPAAQETLQRVETGIRYAQTVDQLVDNKDYAAAASLLLDTASSQISNPKTQQNLTSLSNTIATVDNAVVAFDDGRFNDAIGFAADTIGQPLSTNTREFVNTLQSRADTAEKLVSAVKANDVNASTSLLRELSGGNHGKIIDVIDTVGTAAQSIQGIKQAVENNDFSAAIGLASSLSEGVTGVASPEQVTTVQSLVKAVEQGDVQSATTLIDSLTQGKHSNALNFIKTADSAVSTAEELKTAIENKDFSAAAGLADSLSLSIRGRALPEQISTAVNLVDAVKQGDVSGSSSLLRELTQGKHSHIIDVFDSVGEATGQIQELETAIENQNYSQAADIVTLLSHKVIDGATSVRDSLSALGTVLDSKVAAQTDNVNSATTASIGVAATAVAPQYFQGNDPAVARNEDFVASELGTGVADTAGELDKLSARELESLALEAVEGGPDSILEALDGLAGDQPSENQALFARTILTKLDSQDLTKTTSRGHRRSGPNNEPLQGALASALAYKPGQSSEQTLTNTATVEKLLGSPEGRDFLLGKNVSAEARLFALDTALESPDLITSSLAVAKETPIWSNNELNTVWAQESFANFKQSGGGNTFTVSGGSIDNYVGTSLGQLPSATDSTGLDAEQRLTQGLSVFEGNDLVEPIAEEIRDLQAEVFNGEPVNVTAVPLLYTHPETGPVQLQLYRVEGEGETRFVDNVGRSYVTVEQWEENNQLPAGQVTYSGGLDGEGELVSAVTHKTVDTFTEKLLSAGDKIALVGGIAASGVLLVGSAGMATPLVAAAWGTVGASALYTGTRAGMELDDRASFGQSINPMTDPGARSAWLSLGASALSASGMGLAHAAGKLATGSTAAINTGRAGAYVNTAANYVDALATGNAANDVRANWDELTPTQRAQGLLDVVFYGAMTGVSAKAGGGNVTDAFNLGIQKAQADIVSGRSVSVSPALADSGVSVVHSIDGNGVRTVSVQHAENAGEAEIKIHQDVAAELTSNQGVNGFVYRAVGGEHSYRPNTRGEEVHFEVAKHELLVKHFEKAVNDGATDLAPRLAEMRDDLAVFQKVQTAVNSDSELANADAFGQVDASPRFNPNKLKITAAEARASFEPVGGIFKSFADYKQAVRADWKPLPDTTYQLEGITVKTDGLGRPESVSGQVDPDRNVGRIHGVDTKIGKQTGAIGNDIGFHLGADQLGFPGGPLNLVSGDKFLNNKEYKALETEIRVLHKGGNTVEVIFVPIYNLGNSSPRPDGFVVKYGVKEESTGEVGLWEKQDFYNTASQQ